MIASKSITISIPVYNDMHSIVDLMQEFQDAGLNSQNIHYLLIEDGSQDQSAKIIQDLSLKYSNIQTIFHQNNMGFGYTIKEAVTIPETDYILFISGDHQFDVYAAKKLLGAILPEVDYVLGIRDKRADNLYRKVISYTYNFIISILTNQKVSDVNSIFIVKSSAIKNIHLKSKSAFIHAEIFLKLKQKKFNCQEVTIPHLSRKYGKGSGGKLRIVIPTLIDFLKFVFTSKNN